MIESTRLDGHRIALLAADGFEKVELEVPLKALRLAGATVDVVSLRPGRIRGVNMHEPAGKVQVTMTVQEADPKNYEGIFIPGGFINPDLLRQSAEAREFVHSFDVSGKPIATICHGAWVLASAGMLRGRTITSWPGIRDDVVNAGAIWLDQAVVRDGNLITSRGPQDLMDFVPAIIDAFSGAAPYAERAPAHAASAPQRNEPPKAMLTAMKWMPTPTVRTALGIGAIAIGAVAMSRRKAQPRHAGM
ncbi:intracellular protease, PfpI family, putative [Geotalea daltonii FRC-32]|uniref:Intracellular protease, PfpI family, putative n=1 Tax=Geotalea daltonii (strain DSM 22248 / JCM 15807 / FRC-32) TaxID=316067 RepID=B9M1L7_GEODF|nr:type 1 glutamine amidotransferase domain-containing protein [Geotalea daltonii]ACM21099.1 intracellular protease, PfpI family, putative [Geotalea daltonii FRC-32]